MRLCALAPGGRGELAQAAPGRAFFSAPEQTAPASGIETSGWRHVAATYWRAERPVWGSRSVRRCSGSCMRGAHVAVGLKWSNAEQQHQTTDRELRWSSPRPLLLGAADTDLAEGSTFTSRGTAFMARTSMQGATQAMARAVHADSAQAGIRTSAPDACLDGDPGLQGAAPKVIWVASEEPSVLAAADEAGWATVLFCGGPSDQESGAPSESPEAHSPVYDFIIRGGAIFAANSASSSGHEDVPGRGSRELQRVGCVVEVGAGADQAILRAVADDSKPQRQALHGDGSREAETEAVLGSSAAEYAVLDASQWKIITAENAVAMFHGSATRVLGTATTAEEALLLLQALEVGLHGAVLCTDDPAEVLALQEKLLHESIATVPALPPPAMGTSVPAVSAAVSDKVALQWARVTAVKNCGMAHRVCVDLCSLLPPGTGLLVGSYARGLFLVHSECLESEFVPSRPFRVNAGPVCSYVALPGGRTAYLSELSAGSEVLVVDASTGKSSPATVGRCKIEIRPMVLVQAELTSEPPQAQGNGALSIFLQNAETVRLMVPAGVQGAGAIAPGQDRGPGYCTTPRAAADLQVGDRVLVTLAEEDGVARHTGIAVREYILEK